MAKVKYKKRFWTMLSLWVLIALIIGGTSIGYFMHYSATNHRVCTQCHPELVQLWKDSKGHPAQSTSCFECHSDHLVPAKYLADDSLTSQRCLDCHEDVLELGYPIKKKVITFNHRVHRQEGLECVDCHRYAGHEYLSGGTNRPSIPECVLCHIREFEGPPKSQKCLNCHDVMLSPGRMWTSD